MNPQKPPSDTLINSQNPPGSATGASLAKFIDHTLLKPEATLADLKRHCSEARQFHFKTVCVRPDHLKAAVELLKGSEVLAITVVGFPTGSEDTETKVKETLAAKSNGAAEIDMVIAVQKLKSKDRAYVLEDIQSVVKAARPLPVKVILETALLNREEKIEACKLTQAAGAHFVKTSTGFVTSTDGSNTGATVEDVKLMRATVGPSFGVKASGGIRDYKTAVEMIQAGANRLGTSASQAIVENTEKSDKTPSNY